jgi:hypothetical protein
MSYNQSAELVYGIPLLDDDDLPDGFDIEKLMEDYPALNFTACGNDNYSSFVVYVEGSKQETEFVCLVSAPDQEGDEWEEYMKKFVKKHPDLIDKADKPGWYLVAGYF